MGYSVMMGWNGGVVGSDAGFIDSSSKVVGLNGKSRRRAMCCAAVIPGNSAGEAIVVGGLGTFLGLYSNIITARILLSWFPGLQNQPLLRPIYTICDPFLNVFRGVIPPIFGLDLSPIIAITLLQALGSASFALGAEADSSSHPQRFTRNPFHSLFPSRK
uniref:Uncharacterized protein n=1 Tax=Timspurckia oligopyrenoides TaxID=708627 RepID=A0A7S0ZBV6_9RHOD|mmetsp:Transcript_11753/g.21266  ORF Transcript_11753/g.21266 Transcript_11753/m.21266 type:complete len:160 (+) Transcript_11753:30-509(+)